MAIKTVSRFTGKEKDLRPSTKRRQTLDDLSTPNTTLILEKIYIEVGFAKI